LNGIVIAITEGTRNESVPERNYKIWIYKEKGMGI